MANEEHVWLFRQGVNVWNPWRREHPDTLFDLSHANLKGVVLQGGDLSNVNFTGTNLSEADLVSSDFRQADLTGAKLWGTKIDYSNLSKTNLSGAILVAANLFSSYLAGADLSRAQLNTADFTLANLKGASLVDVEAYGATFAKANLIGADLRRARLNGVYFGEANLSEANLTQANLSGVRFSETIVHKAKISGCHVHGVNVWDLNGEFEEQKDLIISRWDQPILTVDNIKVAQFVYLILNNEEIRDVINTLTSKSVLILGRFALPERKAILDALRNKLREFNLLPIVFDFDRPTNKDFTETIKTLAGLSYFVIADITNPKSSPLELQATVPDYQIPFVPIIQEGESPFAMMANLQTKYNWVLDTISYDSLDTLIEILKPHIIDPAIKKHDELRKIKANVPTVISGKDLLSKK